MKKRIIRMITRRIRILERKSATMKRETITNKMLIRKLGQEKTTNTGALRKISGT